MFLAATLATVAVVGYVYTPQLIDRIFGDSGGEPPASAASAPESSGSRDARDADGHGDYQNAAPSAPSASVSAPRKLPAPPAPPNLSKPAATTDREQKAASGDDTQAAVHATLANLRRTAPEPARNGALAASSRKHRHSGASGSASQTPSDSSNSSSSSSAAADSAGSFANATTDKDTPGHGGVDAAAIHEATGLTPATADRDAQVPAPAAAEAANGTVKDRWINELSGTNAHITMGVAPTPDGCMPVGGGCERPEQTQDVSLAGVVAKTNGFKVRPLAGELAEGSYDKHLPAIYLK
jgi:hypothetical protein